MTLKLANIAPPQQARSRKVLKKIVAATTELMRSTPFEDIAVTDIARQAGVGVGTIYTRFSSKNQILLYIVETVVLVDIRAKHNHALSPQRRRTESLHDFLFRYLWDFRWVYLKHRAVLRPLTLLSRHAKSSELGPFLRAINKPIDEKIRAAMLTSENGIRHPRPAEAAQVAILWLGSAMREKFLYEEPVATPVKLGDKAFVMELVRGAVAYLSSKPLTEGPL